MQPALVQGRGVPAGPHGLADPAQRTSVAALLVDELLQRRDDASRVSPQPGHVDQRDVVEAGAEGLAHLLQPGGRQRDHDRLAQGEPLLDEGDGAGQERLVAAVGQRLVPEAVEGRPRGPVRVEQRGPVGGTAVGGPQLAEPRVAVRRVSRQRGGRGGHGLPLVGGVDEQLHPTGGEAERGGDVFDLEALDVQLAGQLAAGQHLVHGGPDRLRPRGRRCGEAGRDRIGHQLDGEVDRGAVVGRVGRDECACHGLDLREPGRRGFAVELGDAYRPGGADGRTKHLVGPGTSAHRGLHLHEPEGRV